MHPQDTQLIVAVSLLALTALFAIVMSFVLYLINPQNRKSLH
ncbi:MAG TPA: hypothetical protein VKB76_08540 [Ktedonobacterales bacterium]|nr:hypothetical protein [Ktedonobacterales bacterium]